MCRQTDRQTEKLITDADGPKNKILNGRYLPIAIIECQIIMWWYLEMLIKIYSNTITKNIVW